MPLLRIPPVALLPYSEKFNGSTSDINFGSPAYLDDIGLMTIISVFRADGAHGGNLGYITSKCSSTGTNGWRFTHSSSEYKLQLGSDSSGKAINPSRNEAVNTTPQGMARVAAATFTRASILNTDIGLFSAIATSGNLTSDTGGGGTDGLGSINSDASSSFHIGNRDGGARGFNGLIGCVILLREKLARHEINEILQNGVDYDDPRLLLYWAGGRDWSVHNLTPQSYSNVTLSEPLYLPNNLAHEDPQLVWWPTAGGGSYTLTASTGSFTLTGNTTGLKASRKLAVSTGSFTLTGNATGLKASRKLAPSTGSFTLTGIDARLAAARKLAAGVGTYTLTGNNATLTYTPSGPTYTLTAGTGSFTLTGVNAAFQAARKLQASTGSFTLTGNTTGLAKGYRLNTSTGSYTLTGVDVVLKASRVLTGATGTFTLTGNNAVLTYSGNANLVRAEVIISGNRIITIYAQPRETTVEANPRTYTVYSS